MCVFRKKSITHVGDKKFVHKFFWNILPVGNITLAIIHVKNITSLTMPTCSAFGCSNTSVSKDISFHRFPWKNPHLLKRWLAKFNRDPPSQSARLCSAHFEAECFEENLYHKYVGVSPGKKSRPKTKLKKDAIPTIFQQKHEKPTAKPRECSIRRAKARQHNEVRQEILHKHSF